MRNRKYGMTSDVTPSSPPKPQNPKTPKPLKSPTDIIWKKSPVQLAVGA